MTFNLLSLFILKNKVAMGTFIHLSSLLVESVSHGLETLFSGLAINSKQSVIPPCCGIVISCWLGNVPLAASIGIKAEVPN